MDVREENSGRGYCRVRMDRALATANWSALFPYATVEHLTAAKSDHSLILLINEMEARNQRIALKKPFRYECMWECDTRFGGTLEQAWDREQPAATLAELADKLSSVGTALKHWSKMSFGSVRQELQRLRQRLTVLTRMMGTFSQSGRGIGRLIPSRQHVGVLGSSKKFMMTYERHFLE